MVQLYDDQFNGIIDHMPPDLRKTITNGADVTVNPANGFKRIVITLTEEDLSPFRQTRGTLFGILVQGAATEPFQLMTLNLFGNTTGFRDLKEFIAALNNV